MSRRVNRREFVLTSTAGLAVAAAAPALAGGTGAAPASGLGQAPAMIGSRRAQPVVVSSANGNQVQERRIGHVRAEGVHDDDAGRATCSTR